MVGQAWAADNTGGLGSIHDIGAPIHIYPLLENGFRAERGQSIEDNNKESAKLYAEFAKVAEKNPYAWNHGRPAANEEFIGTLSEKNRMICFPCMCSATCLGNADMCRSHVDERLQHGQLGRRLHSYVNSVCGGAWSAKRQMGISTRRRWNER